MPSCEEFGAQFGGDRNEPLSLARLSLAGPWLPEPALPLSQNLLVVFDGDAVSMVPLEDFESLLAS